MIQKTYHISDYSQEKMDAVLTQVSSLSAYQNAGQVLLLIFEQNWDTEKIGKKVEQIRTQLPKAEIAGITHYDNVDAADYQRESTILTFLLFERPAFSVLSLPPRCSEGGGNRPGAGRAAERNPARSLRADPLFPAAAGY